MNGTPRLRSSYPSTPDHGRRSSPESHGSPSGEGGSRIITPVVPRTPSGSSSGNGPIIPLTVLDAPSQRFYVVAIYVALLAWRFYDWKTLLDDEAESFWLFIKWVAIDGVFLYGLPEMRIPWLEWSNPIITGIFLLHAVLNGILMFRIPVSSKPPPSCSEILILLSDSNPSRTSSSRQNSLRSRAFNLREPC
jgi:nucleoporin POM152